MRPSNHVRPGKQVSAINQGRPGEYGRLCNQVDPSTLVAVCTQLGLTATPKETEDVSNINYFCAETDDKPLYTYSLKQGIEDGFLAPYRVISVELNIDKDGYRPPSGKLDVDGKPVEDRVYRAFQETAISGSCQ